MGKQYILVLMPSSKCSIWASTKMYLEPKNPNRKLNMRPEEPTSFLTGLYAKGCCSYKKIRKCRGLHLKGLETCSATYFCPFINLVCVFLDMKQWRCPGNDTWASSARAPSPAIIRLYNWQDHLDEMISGVFSWKGTEKSLGSHGQGVRTPELIPALTRVALLMC